MRLIQKNISRGTALCLSLCLVLSLCPAASAAGEDDGEAALLAELEGMEAAAERGGLAYDGYIVKLKDGVSVMLSLDDDSTVERVKYTANTYTVETAEEAIETFSAADIEYIEPDYIVTLDDPWTQSATEPNDQYYQNGYQWNLDTLNVPVAWEYGLEGQSLSDGEPIAVAVIDSGVNYEHEDIDASHLLLDRAYSWVTTDTSDVKDALGHGTFCTGQIMATRDNEVGIAGIAPEVYVLPLRVFGTRGSGYTSDIVAAINYATAQGVDVISMSLGGEGSTAAQKAACEKAVEAGILVVASAGNDGDYTPNYPAAYDCVVGVGSLGTDDSHTEVSSFSQRGTTNVFCTAPGYKLVSAYYNSASAYYRGSGTSFSCPEVAALAAIVKSIDRDIAQDEFMQLLSETCVDLGAAGRDADYGYGMADFKAAAEALLNTEGAAGAVSFAVTDEDGAAVAGAEISVRAEGSGTPETPNADGSYTLSRGRYTYTASAPKYETASGSFYVITDSRVVRVTMRGLPYDVSITPYNTNGDVLEDAVITVRNSKGIGQTETSFGRYSLRAGAYTYSISAAGYYTQTGSFRVDEGGASLDVTVYGDIDVASAVLRPVDADGRAVSGVTVTVYNAEGGTVSPYADGYYKFYPGDYTYSAKSSAYLTETGSFTVTDNQKGTVVTIDVPMENPILWVYFEVVPIYAEVALYDAGGEAVEPYAAGEYRLLKGDYSYVVTAEGYSTVAGAFTLTTAGKTIEIEMESGGDDGYATVTYVSGGGSAVAAQRVLAGTRIAAPEPPEKAGYSFAGWYKEASLTTSWDFDTDVVTGDTVLYAKWLPATWRIVYMFGDEELTGLSPAEHTYGVVARDLPVPEIEGWHFLYWCADAALEERVDAVPAAKLGDMVLYARCAADTGEYTVRFDSGGGSAVAERAVTAADGYRISRPDDPVRAGYTFSGWYSDEALTAPWDFEADRVSWHLTLYAGWTANVYRIAYMSGDAALSLSPSSYTYGETVLRLPSPEDGDMVFGGWYADAALTARVRGIPAGFLGDLTLYAKWTDKTVSVPEDCDYEPDADGNYPAVSEDGYTLIYTQAQLEALGDTLYTASEARALAEVPKYRLAQSILLTGEWLPLGSGGYLAVEFDGAGHTIAGLYINSVSGWQSLFGNLYNSTIKNLTVYGSVKGSGTVAGVASECYMTDFINVTNGAGVTNAGTTSATCAAGVVARLHNGSVVNCVNTGAIINNGTIGSSSYASSVNATGGILGSTDMTTGSTIIVADCANHGDIANASGTPTGGIAGSISSTSSASCIKNCYNTGSVTQTGTDSEKATCGTAAGIVGALMSARTISGCYNTGEIVSRKTASGTTNTGGYEYLAAAIAMYHNTSSPTGYSDCLYLQDSCDSGLSFGRIQTETSAAGYVWFYGVSPDTAFAYSVDYAALIAALGTGYTADPDGGNSGYPVLDWQAADSFSVQFDVRDGLTGDAVADADITVDGAAATGGPVALAPGLHRYTVRRSGYESLSSAVYLGRMDAALTVNLTPETYPYTITVSPADAALKLTNAALGTIAPESTEETADGTRYVFLLHSSELYGDYAYTASRYGLTTASGTFSVTGAGSRSLDLSEAAYQTVNFEIYPEGAAYTLAVRTSGGAAVAPYEGTLYRLMAGDYTYEIRADGFYTVAGDLTVPGAVTNVSVVLRENAGWSGESDIAWYDAGAAAYHLGSAEELAGFRDLCNGTGPLGSAKVTFAGKTVYLDADIDLLGKDWTSVGVYSTGFQGVFDGQGHTISGLSSAAAASRTGGLFGYVSGATIQNLTVKGAVSSGYSYAGGVAASAKSSAFIDIDSYVDVTTSNYQAGGVAGSLTGGCTFLRCRNYGSVIATKAWTGTNSYAIGGIAGADTGTGSTFTACRNNGTVGGPVQSVGGIVGYAGSTSGASASTVSGCFNAGAVGATENGCYAGGVVGVLYNSYNRSVVSGNLNTGNIATADGVYAGAIVGRNGSDNTTIDGNRFLDTSAEIGVGGSGNAGCERFAAGEYESAVAALGEGFALRHGEPYLSWELADSSYTVSFDVSYDTDANFSDEYGVSYIVTGKDADGMDAEFPVSGGKASLRSGTYSYIVSRAGYTAATGGFTVNGAGLSVPVTLAAERYVFVLDYFPADADVALLDAEGIPVEASSLGDGTAEYALVNGTYSYTVASYGYETVTGSVDVDFAGASVTVEAALLPQYAVGFAVSAGEGAFSDTPTIALYWNGKPLQSLLSGETASLAEGIYGYVARAAGYTTARGSFTVSGADTVSIILYPAEPGGAETDTDWYTDDPAAERFEIGTAAALRGLAALVNGGAAEFEGRTILLTDDIDLSGAAWTPVGSWSGGRFKGTFDGQGHAVTLENGEIGGSEICFGLFGYLEGATVTDLTLRGAVTINAVNNSSLATVAYIGALSGYAEGGEIRRVAVQMDVNASAAFSDGGVVDAGGLIGWAGGGTVIDSCGNIGAITASAMSTGGRHAIAYAGGIAGYGVATGSSSTLSITNCYNTGAVTAASAYLSSAAGIIGVVNSADSAFTMRGCYNAGAVSAKTAKALCANDSISGRMANNYYRAGASSGFGTVKTEAEMKTVAFAAALGAAYSGVDGAYPSLVWERTVASAAVGTLPDKTAYTDMEDFDDSGMTLTVTYTDGSSETVASGWTVLDGTDLRVDKDGPVDVSSAVVHVTVGFRGVYASVPVTVRQAVHVIPDGDLWLEIPAPVAGEQAEALTFETEKYTASVTWTRAGEAFTGVFEEGTFYRAAVVFDAKYVTGEAWYAFSGASAPSGEGVLQVRDKRVSRVAANGNVLTHMTAALTYAAPGAPLPAAAQTSLHLYYEGDGSGSTDYGALLDEMLTLSAGGRSISYTVRELEKRILAGEGTYAAYSRYGGAAITARTLTGIPLYTLFLESGLFAENLSDAAVVTIGGNEYPWERIRATGGAYDAAGNLAGEGLPALLAVAANGAPFTADGPLQAAVPMRSATDRNAGFWTEKASAAALTAPLYLTAYTAEFRAVDEESGGTPEGLDIAVTDEYGHIIEPRDGGTWLLSEGRTYLYTFRAEGYGLRTGATAPVSGDLTVTVAMTRVWDGESYTRPEQGDDGYYLIYTADELMWFNKNGSAGTRVRLMADITLNSGKEYVNRWTPMFCSETGGPYVGVFDGNGHTIYGLYIEWENKYTLETGWDGSPMLMSERSDAIGIFGYLGGTVKDLMVTGRYVVLDRPDFQLASWFQMGGIAGYVTGTVSGCATDIEMIYAVGTEITTTAGYPDCGYPEACDAYFGGIAGSVSSGQVLNCYALGSIRAEGTRSIRAGGIAGGLRGAHAAVRYCYAAVDIAARPGDIYNSAFDSAYGGIVGHAAALDESRGGAVEYCFALGTSIDGVEPLPAGDARTVCAGRVAGAGQGGAKLNYNYGNQAMSFSNVAYDAGDYSRSSANGANITLSRARSSMQPFTGVGWSTDVWKSDGAESLPTFLWQQGGDSETNYPVAVAAEGATVAFTGGVTEGSTTSRSTVTFTVTPDAGLRVISVVCAGAGTVTGAGGHYTAYEITGPLTITVETAALRYGDVDGDGRINALDAMLVLRYAAGLQVLDAGARGAADVDGDGVINSRDAVLILRYGIGKIASFERE